MATTPPRGDDVSDRADILRQEARALAELAELMRDPVYAGWGMPRGDRRNVLVIPGLFGNDLYLQPLRDWLRRLGYTPVSSSLQFNAGCPNRRREEVEAALNRQLRHRPGRVSLVGHSRGGMLAWALASRLRAEACDLVLLGSPAPAVVAMMRQPVPTMDLNVAASPVAQAGARALRLLDPDCTVPACGCDYVQDLRRPLSPQTRVLAVQSRDDQVVAPAVCGVPAAIDGVEVTNVEVGGTHSGLVYNKAVYPVLARFLAGRSPVTAGTS